jgi:hypothetical protein
MLFTKVPLKADETLPLNAGGGLVATPWHVRLWMVSMEHRDATLDTDSGAPDRVARVRISRASVRRAFV